MFKKATLALAISGLLGASAAQAAVVYDQDGTTLDIYGRIAMGFEGGGEKNGSSSLHVDLA
jgi:predicted porin